MKEIDNSFDSVYGVALIRLGISAMTKKQMERYLLKKGYERAVISMVLDRLSSEKHLDDLVFASNLVRKTLEHNPKSRAHLTSELRFKGIDDENLYHAMQEFDLDKQLEMAVRLSIKYLRRFNHLDKETARLKISQALYRKGFEWSVISRATKDLFSGE